MENQKKEREITFGYLMNVFKKSLIFMLLAAMLFGIVGVAYSKFIDKPKYQATASFMVKNISPESYYTSGLTMASTSIASSCVEFANHQNPRLMIARYNDLWQTLGYADEYECADAINGMMVAKKGADENACSFYITVKSASRDVTYAVTNAIENVFPIVVQDIFGNDNKAALAKLKVEYEAKLMQLNALETANKDEEIKKLMDEYKAEAYKLESTDKTNVEALVATTSTLESADAVKSVKTSPLKIGFLLAVVAAVITYCIFFVKTLLDKSIRNEETVKENFEYPIVGVIPSYATPEEQAELKKYHKSKNARSSAPRHYENKLITEKSPFHVSESFNTLRTNVIYSAAAAKNPIFAVTSDVAAAGKTVAAANLAISLANLGKKVLLVECDMRCPAFSKLFKTKSEAGLSELLAGIEKKTEKVVKNVGVENLDVIFCGKIPPNPSELLSSARMKELADEWRSEYDCVIFDMPPLGDVFDAGVVSSIVDGYVIAARCNISDVDEVREAVGRVESVGGSVLGFVLNDINLKASKKYKHYYTYGNEA